MSSFNVKNQIPNDIVDTGLYILKENLKSQEYLDKTQDWTDKQKMALNEEKTKSMLVNFTKNNQFSTRLTLKKRNIKMITEMKLLEVIVTNDLKWHKNTKHITRKA